MSQKCLKCIFLSQNLLLQYISVRLLLFYPCLEKVRYLIIVTKHFAQLFLRVNDVCFQVESLTAARSASQAGTEPSDAIRVVNSVLTQLDQIKRSVSLHVFCTAVFHLQRHASNQNDWLHSVIVPESLWRLFQINGLSS